MLGHQDRIRCCGYKLPTYFWFVVSGAICDTLQALLDYFVSIIYPWEWEKATVCWTTSYVLSIAIRHSSHRLIVFGEYEGTYWNSLGRTYAAYSSSIILSILTNNLLANSMGFSHRAAWIITMLWTGIYNYFILKNSWKSANKGGDNTIGANGSDKALISSV